MGFWNSLGNALTSFGEMNQDAISSAAKLSTDELCQKINSLNVLLNPLIYTACTDELTKRIKNMPKSQLIEYYDEYESQERTDVRDILREELKKRGLYSADSDIE